MFSLIRLLYFIFPDALFFANLISMNTFLPSNEGENGDADPDRVDADRRIGAEMKGVQNKQRASGQVQSLIERRIPFDFSCRDKDVSKKEPDHARPTEDVDDDRI